MKNTQSKKEQTQLINEKIRGLQIQLITYEGENLGIISRDEALKLAFDAGLDLVQISEEGKDGVPIAKIMDFGKSLYEKKKKLHDSKKHQKVIQIKEIKLRPKIGEHDYLTKINQMIQFLKEGKRVKITLSFRGRENISKEGRGEELFQKICASLDKVHLLEHLVQEKDDAIGKLWSRIYYLKKF